MARLSGHDTATGCKAIVQVARRAVSTGSVHDKEPRGATTGRSRQLVHFTRQYFKIELNGSWERLLQASTVNATAPQAA
jgi:hypothetical protein